MSQLSGRGDVYVNGKFIDTFPGISLETGGYTRTSQTTGKRVHFTKKYTAAKLEIDSAFTKDSSINDLDVEGAVIQVKWDTGQTHVMNNAFRVDPASLGDEGKSKTVFQGDACEEIS